MSPSIPVTLRSSSSVSSHPDDADARRLLLARTRRTPWPLAEACRRLHLEPDAVRAIVERARLDGLALALVHDHVLRSEPVDPATVRELAPTPRPSPRFTVGVVSDTHLGSRHCLRRELADFIAYAYRKGARHILHAGDVLDGCYPHGLFELSHSGLEAQTRDLFTTLPKLEGLSYHAIGGNHDDTFSDSAGLDAGAFVEQYFRAHGRQDFTHHGRRSAFLKLGGVVVHLWHPRGSCGKATEPRVREKIESYAPAQKPDVLLVGHWHRYVHTQARGVEGIACPTFQRGGSAFSRSLVGEPAIGGLLLSWTLTAQGAMRSFRLERRSYPQTEPVVVLDAFVPVVSPLGRSRPPGSLPPTEKAPSRKGGAR